MGLKTVAILFVFGAAAASDEFMPRLLRPTPYDMSVMPYLRSTGCPSAPALAPVICQFMEPHMGLFKPQLIAPSTYIPPLIVEKCDKPQLEIELPPKKSIVIPEAPILPPITIPKFPVPIIAPLPPVSIVEPCEPVPIAVTSGAADIIVTDLNIPAAPALPPLEMAALPEIVEVHGADMFEAVINDQPLMVPHPPMVPALVMPEFSVVPPMVAPCLEDEPISLPIPEFIQPLAPIPTAPMLPPARLPEIPVHVEFPQKPIGPPMIIEQAVPTLVMSEPCLEDELIQVTAPEFIQPLAPIPAAPELPPARLSEIPLHVEIPPQPIAPPMIIEHIEEPCITGEIVRHPQPVIIAQPPRIPEPMPILAAHKPAIIADPCEPAIQPVMTFSRLPYFVSAMPSYNPAPAMRPVLYPAHSMLPYKRHI